MNEDRMFRLMEEARLKTMKEELDKSSKTSVKKEDNKLKKS